MQWKIYVKILSTIALMLINVNIYSQDFLVKKYTVEEGMFDCTITNMTQDSLGFIWLQSNVGIIRFDGKTFKLYKIFDPETEQYYNQHFHNFMCSPDGTLYAVGPKGMYKLDKEKDEFISCMDGYEGQKGQDIPEFQDAVQVDSVIYTSSFVGLYSYNTRSREWGFIDLTPGVEHRNNHHSPKACRSLLIDEYDPNNLLVGGMSRFYEFDISKKQVKKIHELDLNSKYFISIHHFVQPSENEIYINTYGRGIVKFDRHKESIINKYNESESHYDNAPFLISLDALLLDNSHLLVTDARGELMALYPNDLSLIPKDYSLYGAKHRSIFRDKDDNIWLGGTEGLTKLSPKPFKEIKIDKNDGQIVIDVIPSNTCEYFVVRYPNVERTELVRCVDDNIVLTGVKFSTNQIQYDREENTYLYTDNNMLCTYDLSKHTKTGCVELTYGTDYVDFKIFEQKYYLLYKDRMVVKSKSGKILYNIAIPDSLTDSEFYARHDIGDIAGDYLYIFNDRQILKIDFDSESVNKLPLREFSSTRGVYEYQDILITPNNSNGIKRLKYDSIKMMYLEENLLPKGTRFISRFSSEDSEGNIWMATGTGVKCYNPTSGKLTLDVDARYGLKFVDKRLFETKNEIVTSNTESILIFDKKRRHPKIYDIYVEKLMSQKSGLVLTDNISLVYTDNDIEVEWGVPYYGIYEQLCFYTKLEGRDSDWVNQGSNLSNKYNGLSPGNYSLHVKVESPGESVEKKILQFEIIAPWWKTWIFYLIMSSVLALIPYWIYRRRVQSLLAKSKLDRKIAQLELKALRAQLNPHFIFNSLNSIKRLIQKNDNNIAIDYLVLFANMVRNVLDISNKDTICLKDEIEFSEQYLKMEKLRFGKNFSYQIDVDSTIDMYEIVLPPMILQPHLENAIWHGIMPLDTRDGRLLLTVKDKIDMIEISISDNGIGRDASRIINQENMEYKHESKGTSIINDRLKMNALISEFKIEIKTVDILNTKNEIEGTKVTIIIEKLSR